MIKGLSTEEVKQRLQENGYNELPSSKPKNLWHIALEVMKEPMFLLLISCGALYIIIGDYSEGVILLAAILVIIFITFYQYQKTEKALEALKKLSSPRALVIREGVEVRIPGREVVPGDIILLNEGDRVAADALVLDTVNLIVDESLLTGESIPVTKEVWNDLSDSRGLIFSGTLVIQGKGMAEVTATGPRTQFGTIGTSLQGIVQEETRLQKEMKVLIRNLFIIGIVISIGVVVAFYITRGNLIQSILNGLAATMSILPEEFPVVLTIFLALGAWRLSKKNVLTRKSSAIETLGAATVLCSDKTGTITQNKMEVAALYDGKEIFKRDDFSKAPKPASGIISAAHHASQKDSVDPMEKAITHLHKTIVPSKEPDHKLIREYPFSRELLAMTRVTERSTDGAVFVSVKGAPEAIFSLCKMNAQEIASHSAALHQLAGEGYRVIAVARGSCQKTLLPEKQQDFLFQFLGLIALEDPVRPEVSAAIKECKEAGVKVIMITGDFPVTAKSIALQIGLEASKEMITGDELKNMPDAELQRRIVNVNIFARVIPEQKLRIVQALKANNEIVAMTGDGVNDAPALKAAHIGIAMGNKGTDVAREASSLVLLDDNFASIVSAIRSGRRIFDNLQKAMSYIMAIHIPIIGLVLVPAFMTSVPLLLMPLHIVFLELIIDPVCSIAFESQREERGIMKRAPRDPGEQFFGKKKIFFSLLQGFLLLTFLLTVYFLSIREGHRDGEIRAIAFSSLIIGNIFLILTNLSKTKNIIAVIMEKNIATLIILSTATIMLLLILFVPALQNIFSMSFPGYRHFTLSLSGAFTVLIILETIKYFRNRKSAALREPLPH